MKYGRLIFGRNNAQGKNQYGNLGDFYQSFAVLNLYKYMGISGDDILDIRRTDISSYRGERAVLPLQGCFLHLKGAPLFPVSPDIDPVFFGFHCLSVADRKQLRRLPEKTLFGCRDEPTCELLRRLGKRAYITGCLTMSLPKRSSEPENGKVFLVDVPDGTELFMPENLRRRAEYVSQSYFLDNGLSDAETFDALEKKSCETLEKYRDEAALVITSRLHAAAPCTAMGIPVILVRKYFDERYSWIEKYLPLYTPERFGEIDWNVKAPDIEDAKELILSAAAAAVRGDDSCESLLAELDRFYRDRNAGTIHKPLYTKAYHFMQGTFPKAADFTREVLLKKFTVDTSRGKGG